MLARLLVTVSLAAAALAAQSLRDCRTVYLSPMPESLEDFIGVQLLKWGAIQVVTSEEKADCVAAFGRRSASTDVRTTGAETSDTSVREESARRDLPEAHAFFGSTKEAALTVVSRRTAAIVWADAKSDAFSLTGGPKTLARRLVDQMKKDYAKEK